MIVGLKPVEEKHVEHWKKKMNIDTFNADCKAAREFLICCMNVPEEEANSIKILKTKHLKEKNILYKEMEMDTVAELFKRGSKANNRESS